MHNRQHVLKVKVQFKEQEATGEHNSITLPTKQFSFLISVFKF